jgi:DNA-binding CsgD family transcriptional regulator
MPRRIVTDRDHQLPEQAARPGESLRGAHDAVPAGDVRSRAVSAELDAVRCADHGLLERSVQHLRDALACYEEIGSSRDCGRVRSLLRERGVRVRHWTYETRTLSGWQSLTATETQVSELVARGLTNREVAAGMFLSAHTVAFHLRQVFRKLDIRSRVELARLVVEREHSLQTA